MALARPVRNLVRRDPPDHAGLALEGRPGDFADSIRVLWPAHAAVGVLYLEGFRAVLRALGTTVFSMRFAGAVEGCLSIVTAMLLARALLPRGGAALTGLAFAGMRWPIIIARFGWNGLALAPIVDLATLALVRARRRSSLAAAAVGGLIAGLGAHVYLGAWIAVVALGGFVLWPTERPVLLRRRVAMALFVGLGFLATASPIFFLKQGRERSYFVRASDQNLLKDVARKKSWLVPFSIVADSVQSPWFVSDPDVRQDLPVSRLGMESSGFRSPRHCSAHSRGPGATCPRFSLPTAVRPCWRACDGDRPGTPTDSDSSTCRR